MISLTSLLQDYAHYNYWANERIVNWLRTHPAEILKQEVPSSFPTIQGTLLHNCGAEDLWRQRLEGIQPAVFAHQQFDGSAEALFETVLSVSAALRDFVLAQTDEYWQQVHHYKLLNGTEMTNMSAHMIQHCIQHSTFHRGQIVTIARNLGITDPPSTDFIRFAREFGTL